MSNNRPSEIQIWFHFWRVDPVVCIFSNKKSDVSQGGVETPYPPRPALGRRLLSRAVVAVLLGSQARPTHRAASNRILVRRQCGRAPLAPRQPQEAQNQESTLDPLRLSGSPQAAPGTQGHTVSKWLNQNSGPSRLAPESHYQLPHYSDKIMFHLPSLIYPFRQLAVTEWEEKSHAWGSRGRAETIWSVAPYLSGFICKTGGVAFTRYPEDSAGQ